MANNKGRPKLAETRDKMLRVRFTKSEYNQLKLIANEYHKTMSQAIRDMIAHEFYMLYYGHKM